MCASADFQYPQPDRLPCNRGLLDARRWCVFVLMARQAICWASQRVVFVRCDTAIIADGSLFRKPVFVPKQGGIFECIQLYLSRTSNYSRRIAGENCPDMCLFDRHSGRFSRQAHKWLSLWRWRFYSTIFLCIVQRLLSQVYTDER